VTGSALPGLPGATEEAGSGPVVETLVDGLLADPVPVPPGSAGFEPDGGTVPIERPHVADALATHRDHRGSWYGDLLGPLRVPTSAVSDVAAGLIARDHGMPVMLVPPPGSPDPLAELHAARALLIDDDRVQVTGVELPLPRAAEPALAARAALAALDVSVPAWFVVPPDTAWLPALDVLAEDGAESVALHLGRAGSAATGTGDGWTGAAAVLRRAVDLDVAVAVTAGGLPVVTDGTGCGLLNLLGAVRAALNGADVAEVAAVLAATTPEPLAAAARRMSDADAAVVRAFLPVVTCPSIRSVVEDLESLGLIAPDAA
jgi:hypothetical protein